MSEYGCDILFLGERGLFPFDQGFKVHGSQMARVLAARGFDVQIATIEPTDAGAPAWLKRMIVPWPEARPGDEAALLDGWAGRLQKLRRRIAAHQGVDTARFAAALRLVEQAQPRVVIGLGQHSPMMLRSIKRQIPSVTVIWYAADEMASFQLSCLRREGWRGLGRLRNAVMYALLERAFAAGLDGAIGVSPRDTRLLRWIARPKRATTIRNGVDLSYFVPIEQQPAERSAVFWGRMDFEPNVDAMQWFARHVWPQLVGSCGSATLRIVGAEPAQAVSDLAEAGGSSIEVTGAVADIRPEARRAMVVVLPMRCGGGIKNKLLEAAAMGLPIVASPCALRGLNMQQMPPVVAVCREPGEWVETIRRLWQDASLRQDLGRRARKWVEREHTWDRAAEQLIAFCGDRLWVGRDIRKAA